MKYLKTGIVFLLLLPLFACGDRVLGWSNPQEGDVTPPTVTSTAPELGATDVAINTVVVATFSEAMDTDTISDTTFTVRQGTDAIAGRVSYAGLTAIFTPEEPLASDAETVVTISTDAADLAGNSMVEPYVWSFTTGVVADELAPFVVGNTPPSDATGVDPGVTITGTFSEALDPSTVTESTVNVVGDGTPVPGTVTYAGNTATFSPTDSLDEDATYEVTFDNAITDLAGNNMVDDFTWSFTTRGAFDTTRPSVSSTIPAAGAVGVVLNASVLATFTEEMDATTLTPTSFTVRQGAVALAGTLAYFGETASFSPAEPFEPETEYTATILATVTDLAGNQMGADYVWTFTTGLVADSLRPIVTSTIPAAGAVEVAAGTNIAAVFSESMDAASISTDTFQLSDGVAPVPGAVTYVGLTATFDPTAPLASDTTYTATITSIAMDLAGNALASDFVWSFTTGDTSDTTAPTVVDTSPNRDSVGLAVNSNIAATFSEPMDAATLNAATFLLFEGGTEVPGVVTYAGTTATFDPTGSLAPDTTYSATIRGTVTDLSGNPMLADYTWEFATGAQPDLTRPRVSSVFPTEAAIGVSFSTNLTITFSERMDPLTITTATFTLFDGLTPVTGTVTYSGVTARFNPSVPLDGDTEYTAGITSDASDLAGNRLLTGFEWTFTTGTEPDTTAPTVIGTSPNPDSVGLAVNSNIAATFSEPMDAATLNATTFLLFDGGTEVPGVITYAGTTATFDPTGSLAPDATYSATIRGTVTDLSGNPMLADYTWEFATGAQPDLTRPRVSSVSPAHAATGVSFSTNLTITFSERMDPLTITTATFTLFDGLTPVTGTVTYSGVTATFNPSAPLDGDTEYTAGITSDASDLAGNRLLTDFEWTFTTGTEPDTTAPLVTFVTPPNGATGVAHDTNISAVFSEVMDPATISTLTFTVDINGTPVPGLVSFVGLTAVFDPLADLTPETVYTATIHSGVSDLSGNTLAADFVWSFTAGLEPDTERPRVASTTPVDDATAVAIEANIAVVFSETMDPLTVTTENFTVQQVGVVVQGAVTCVNRTCVFNPNEPLVPFTIYSATVTTSARDLAGNSLIANYVWNFETGASPDTVRPRVISTIPDDLAIDVPLDTNVTARFSEAMDPLTFTTETFTLRDGLLPVAGIVSLVGSTAVFEPSGPLTPDTEYTATISDIVSDLAGNTIVADWVWTFTTGIAIDVTPPTVTKTAPLDLATDVPLNASVNATFSEPMNPLTITTATFTLTSSDLTEVIGTVEYDTLEMIGTFLPGDELLPLTTYTAKVSTGVTDVTGTSMEDDYVWTFTTADALVPGLAPVNLGSLSSFVAVAGAGLTNSNSSGTTILNGDVGLNPTATCMGDGAICTALNPVINGTLYANDPGGIAAQAKVDLTAAYVDATSRPPGTLVNDISGLVLPPGVYTSASTMSIAVGGTVTLDGQGDANSVFIFQIGSSLTVNNDASVLLINGAKASNVFWAVFASSTLGSNVDFSGSVLAGASNSVGTDSVVLGRLLCITGQITLLSNAITLPPL